MDHPQLKRLKIHRYEKFVDVPWIEFSPHENLILGINGAGKTRLLALIKAVLSFDYGPFLREDLDVEFELSYPSDEKVSGVVMAHGRVTCRGGTQQHESHARPDPGEAATSLTARVEMRYGADGAVIVIEGLEASVRVNGSEIKDRWRVLPGYAWPIGNRMVSRALVPFAPGFAALSVGPDDSDFTALTAKATYWLGESGITDRFDGSLGSEYYPIAVLIRSWAQLEANEQVVGLKLGRDSSLTPFGSMLRTALAGVLEPLGAQLLMARPRIVSEGTREVECQGVELRLKFTSGAEVHDPRLTFGQRRFLMIGLLLLCTAHYPILIDEIDNGLHPRLLESAFKLLPGRQSFLVSHNKSVVDLLNYTSAEDLRQRIHVCRRDEAGNQTVDALAEATAQDIFEKISIGIMHPSDVLLVEGLW